MLAPVWTVKKAKAARSNSKEPGSAARVEYRALLKPQPEHPPGMQLWPLCRGVYTTDVSTSNAVVDCLHDGAVRALGRKLAEFRTV